MSKIISILLVCSVATSDYLDDSKNGRSSYNRGSYGVSGGYSGGNVGSYTSKSNHVGSTSYSGNNKNGGYTSYGNGAVKNSYGGDDYNSYGGNNYNSYGGYGAYGANVGKVYARDYSKGKHGDAYHLDAGDFAYADTSGNDYLTHGGGHSLDRGYNSRDDVYSHDDVSYDESYSKKEPSYDSYTEKSSGGYNPHGKGGRLVRDYYNGNKRLFKKKGSIESEVPTYVEELDHDALFPKEGNFPSFKEQDGGYSEHKDDLYKYGYGAGGRGKDYYGNSGKVTYSKDHGHTYSKDHGHTYSNEEKHYGGSAYGVDVGYTGGGVHVDKYDGNALRNALLDHDHEYGKSATKSEGKSLSEHEHANIYAAASVETNNDGYDQNINYQGGSLWADELNVAQGYKKGEDYEKGNYAGYDKKSDYAGGAQYVNNDATTLFIKAYELNHTTNYNNNFEKERHDGSYKGKEFDVEYDVVDVSGGYANSETKGKYDAEANKGDTNKGKAYKGGSYHGDDYIKYGDYSKEGAMVEYPERNPAYANGMSEAGYGALPKYDDEEKAQEEEDGYNRRGDRMKRRKDDDGGKHGLSNAYGREMSYSKDGSFRGYGANYEGKDFYGKEKQSKGYVKANENSNNKKASDYGSYREVNAKGHNKAAAYQGDYKDYDKSHKIGFDTHNYEDYKERGLRRPHRAKVESYYSNYKGSDYKGAFSAENKYGSYKDAEFKKEYDDNEHNKKYYGDSFVNGFSGETAGIFYAGAHKDEGGERSMYRYPRAKKSGGRYGIYGDEGKHDSVDQKYGFSDYGYGYDAIRRGEKGDQSNGRYYYSGDHY